MLRNIHLSFTGLLFVAVIPATAWAYGYYGYPGDRGYQPYPGPVRDYQRPGSLRVQKGMTEQGYYLHVDLQGLQADEVQVFIRHNRLVLQSVQDDEYGEFSPGTHRVTRSHRRFRKQLRLPYDADWSRMTKTAKDGVLEIYIPRMSYAIPSKPSPER